MVRNPRSSQSSSQEQSQFPQENDESFLVIIKLAIELYLSVLANLSNAYTLDQSIVQ